MGAGGWVGCGGGPGRGAGELTGALGYSFWKSPFTVSMRFWASLQTRKGYFEGCWVSLQIKRAISRGSLLCLSLWKLNGKVKAPVTPYR